MSRAILFFWVVSITFAVYFYSVNGTGGAVSGEVSMRDAGATGNEDSARYFPLKIGNKYVYRHVRTGTCTNDSGMFVSRITDTVRYNGKLYYKMNTVFNRGSSVPERYYRYDADSGNLAGYDQYSDFCNYEKIQFKLTMLPGTNLISMCLYLNPQTCKGVRDSVLFGAQRKVKIFYHSAGSQTFSVSSTSILAKDVGLTRYTYTYTQYLPGTTCTDVFDLTGAYVNGVVYGDTVTGVFYPGNEVPRSFELGQNFPNPFNAETVISFRLPASSDVTLKIYDVMGREVQMPVNERLGARMHEVRIDGSVLTSGVYFYSLRAGEFFEVRRMVVLK